MVCSSSITHSPIQSTSSDLSGKSCYLITHFIAYDKISPSHRYFLASVTVEIKPTRYSELVTHPKWRSAMRQEIDALEKNDTWILTSLPLANGHLVVSGYIESNIRQTTL